jgi:hypothetical protein
MATQKLVSAATKSVKIEKKIHDGSDLSVVAKQKKAIADKEKDKLCKELAVIAAKHNQDQDLTFNNFSDDLSKVIRKSSKISLPKFRKITLVKKLEVINVTKGKPIDTVFIDKLGYRIYDDQVSTRFGYVRYPRKDKQQMISYLEKKHQCEITLKEDDLSAYRLGAYSIHCVSFTDVLRPYNGDPKIEKYYIVFKNENIFVGKYADLDLAKQAVIYQ